MLRVRQATFSAGGQHPQWNTEQSGKEERHSSHNQGGPDGRRQFFYNRPPSVIGISEIPMQGIPQPGAVLLKDRLIEAEFFPHQFNLLWGRAVVTAHCQRLSRIYRGQVGVKEG